MVIIKSKARSVQLLSKVTIYSTHGDGPNTSGEMQKVGIFSHYGLLEHK